MYMFSLYRPMLWRNWVFLLFSVGLNLTLNCLSQYSGIAATSLVTQSNKCINPWFESNLIKEPVHKSAHHRLENLIRRAKRDNYLPEDVTARASRPWQR